MLFIAALIIGELVGSMTWQSLRGAFSRPVFARTNYRGHRLVTASGLVVPLGTAAIAAVAALFGPFELLGARAPLLAVVTGFALVGFVDDIAGAGESGGFSGHLRALRRGQVTTGALKLFGGPLIAIAALAGTQPETVGLLRVAAIVSLAANFFNLLDRAPGRVIKFSILALAGLAIGGGIRYSDIGFLAPVAGVIGVGIGLLKPDLAEESMLGDVGANAIGAALGIGLVAVCTETGEWISLGVLLVLNLASERWSYSRIIDAVPPLRWFDRLGTQPERRESP